MNGLMNYKVVGIEEKFSLCKKAFDFCISYRT